MKQKTQSGFAHLIIVTVILAVAVVGLVGYVVWQNISQSQSDSVATKPETSDKTTDSPTNPDSSSSPTETTDSEEGYLVLKDWDVKFKLPSTLGSNTISYYKTTGSAGDTYKFSTSRVEAMGDSCSSSNQYFNAMGMISRQTTPSTAQASPPTLAAKIDDYYYYYMHPQSACGDDDSDSNVQIQDMDMLQSMLMSVEKR